MRVYFDTNVYIKNKYVFNSYKLGTIRNLANDGKFTVLYTKATIGEVFKHIEEDIAVAVKAYNRIIRKDMIALKHENIYDVNQLDPKESADKVKQKLIEFLNSGGMEQIELNPLDADKLMDDYFSCKPPFEPKKPNEFKDAIMINAIKNYQKNINKPICIVSEDGGFRKAFEGLSEFKVFESLEDFLKYYNKIEEDSKITDCIEDNIKNEKFKDTIKEYLENYDISLDYYVEWDCEDKGITNINCELLYFENKEERIYATISCEMELLIDITYRNEEESYYDKEEGKYLFEKYVHAKEKHEVNVDLELCWNLEKNDEEIILQEFEIIDDNSNKVIDLDEYETMIDKEVIETNTDDNEYTEYCSQCGKKLINEDYHQDYYGNFLCSNCMKGDSEGSICPECGHKIPYELMTSGYCKDCAEKLNI